MPLSNIVLIFIGLKEEENQYPLSGLQNTFTLHLQKGESNLQFYCILHSEAALLKEMTGLENREVHQYQ